MSVINQMLQDLDKRNEVSEGAAAPGDPVRPIAAAEPWYRRKSLAAVFVALGVVMLALGGWLQMRNKAESQRAAMAVAAPIPAPPPPVLAPASVPPPVVAQTPVAQQAPVAPKAPVVTQAPPVAPPIHAAAAAPVAPSVKPVPPAPQLALAKPSVTPEKAEAPAARSPAVAPVAKPTSAKSYTPKQMAGNLLSEAVALDQQGHLEEAKVLLRRALSTNPLDVEARRMLIQLQFDTGRIEEAQALLSEGHRLMPDQSGFSMGLARLQLEAGDIGGALKILQDGVQTAGDDPQYHAFMAALLLRAQRHDEAVQHYLVALRSDPANPTWLVGAGVALEAVGKSADAAEAYRRASSAGNLAPGTAKFLEERLAQLARR